MKLKLELRKFLVNNRCKIGQIVAENKLNEVETFLDEHCAKKNAEKVKSHIDSVETLEGNFSQLGLWKLKQKLCPQISDPPMAK